MQTVLIIYCFICKLSRLCRLSIYCFLTFVNAGQYSSMVKNVLSAFETEKQGGTAKAKPKTKAKKSEFYKAMVRGVVRDTVALSGNNNVRPPAPALAVQPRSGYYVYYVVPGTSY